MWTTLPDWRRPPPGELGLISKFSDDYLDLFTRLTAERGQDIAGAPLPDGWARSSIRSPCDAIFPANGVLGEVTANTESVARAVVELDLLTINRETGSAPTFRDRRRRADRYRGWPSPR